MFNPYADHSLTTAFETELSSFAPIDTQASGLLLDGGFQPDPAAFRMPGSDVWNPFAIETAAGSIAAIFSKAPSVFLAEALFTAMVDNGHVFEAESDLCACHSHDHGMDAKAQIKAIMADIDALITDLGEGANLSELLTTIADMGDVTMDAVIEALKEVADTLSNEPDGGDVAGDATTTGTLQIGGSVTGLRNGSTDDDWFAVELEAGVEYTFIMLRDGANPLGDPWLRLFNSASVEVASNDDVEIDGDLTRGENQNSLIVFTPTESGTYYVEASAFGNRIGNYTIYAERDDERPDFTLDQAAFFLTDQFSPRTIWPKTDLTYDISALSDGAKTLALAAMEAWAEVSGLTFTAVADGGTADIDFNENNDPDDGSAQAFASTRSNPAIGITGVTVTVSQNWDLDGSGNPDYTLNSYRYQTYLHEVGHALGLGHGGPYNGTSTAFDGTSLQIYNQDAWNYTVMSYINQSEANSGTPRFALGLQIVDIIAIQNLYGVNNNTRTGDSTYGFNSTETGIYDLETNFFNQGIRPPAHSIWDAGGTDTLDFSGYSANQRISLIAETFSDIGDNTVTADTTDALINVLTIARGTVIENAIGGSGNDTFVGNAADNVFTGNAGDDTYSGGAGTDTVILSNNRNEYTISVENGQLVLVNAADGTDRVNISDVEFIGFVNGTQLVSVASLAGTGVTFTEGPDVVVGTASDDDYSALSGDDTVSGEGGNDTIRGGDGADTLSGGQGDDTLIGDTAYVLSGIEGTVYRAYQAVFDRDPDTAGFDLYVNGLRLGTVTQLKMFEDFVGSAEFQATYGNLTNAQFVDLLYANILPGNNDAQGRANYTASLDSAALTRAQVVEELAGSSEFRELARLESAAYASNVILDPIDFQVFRLYEAVFDRAPDAAGFRLYTDGLRNESINLTGIATDFVASTEFQNTYGNLTNAEFVELLYTNVLPGNTDQAGRDSYIASLDSNALTRTAMIVELSESFELRERTDTEAATFIQNYDTSIISDTLTGGAGKDLMFGGKGRDTFVFDDDNTGVDTIMDFESGLDVIQITNVPGFTTFAQVQAAAVQNGTNTVITLNNGNQIILRNVDRDSLTQNDFSFAAAQSAATLKDGLTPVAEPLDIFDDLSKDDVDVVVSLPEPLLDGVDSLLTKADAHMAIELIELIDPDQAYALF
ncbi:DUF4214 domain-containing protein [Algimonas porphyrae]|uniref:Peptidase metallopeptidase domain-containing protein n=1 Tax=Algimonas porphyrae TaxID=1128113 RepID=A0ABQ5V165_9PROT|nr:DUF4214 domain-containing protein [Algimonas porphyrae]GLQ20832.1 hypothetical protein GCM10007854_17870 [Algimonas porphyrae]